jgi:hypothetical protein
VTIFDRRFPMHLLYYSAPYFRRDLTVAILAALEHEVPERDSKGNAVDAAAAPATVTGECSSNIPLRSSRSREGGRKRGSGSQETCLALSSCFRSGCAGIAVTRCDDTVGVVAGLH